mmetsp:Transcript_18893/g.43946  ORF Transcript_18893/g.43946 Transcript_18893/m.43946 type:complete len:206 (+) Transcript_18893:202-819(+)
MIYMDTIFVALFCARTGGGTVCQSSSLPLHSFAYWYSHSSSSSIISVFFAHVPHNSFIHALAPFQDCLPARGCCAHRFQTFKSQIIPICHLCTTVHFSSSTCTVHSIHSPLSPSLVGPMVVTAGKTKRAGGAVKTIFLQGDLQQAENAQFLFVLQTLIGKTLTNNIMGEHHPQDTHTHTTQAASRVLCLSQLPDHCFLYILCNMA